MRYFSIIFLSLITSFSFAQESAEEWQELYEKGKYYREHSNSFRAMQCLEKAINLHESDTIKRELANTYFARGKYQQCIDLCRSVLYPDTLDSDLYLMARSFEKVEKIDSALTYQVMVAERNVENYNNLISLCNTLININQYNEALRYLNSYCDIDSTNSAINTVKAYTLYSANKFKKAIYEYEKLKEEGDDRNSTNYYLGLSYYRDQNIIRAYDMLSRAVEQSNRENPSILSRFGIVELAVSAGHIPLFIDTKPSEGGLPENSVLRAQFEIEGDKFKDVMKTVQKINEQGIADIEEAIEKMQPNKDMVFYLYNNIGNSFVMNNVDRAIEYYRKAQKVDPSRSNINYQLAVCYHRKKDYKQEMHYFEQYLKYAPEDEDPNTIEYAKECIEECRKVLFMKTE